MRNNVIFLALLCAIVVICSGSVSAADAPSANFTSNVTSGAAPLSVQFSDTSNGAPTSWGWNFGDGNVSTDQNPVYTYKKAGTYNVTLTATNDAGSNILTQTNYITVLLNDVYVSPNGSDTTGDGKATNPYATIQNGLNNAAADGKIHLQAGTYAGTGNKGITITKNVTITGEGQANTIIDAQGSGNIFTVNSGINVTIANLTLANGTSTGGAAIYNNGHSTVTNCTITGNVDNSGSITIGGALYNKGVVSLSGCTFTGNSASAVGGAIHNSGGTITSLSDCIFTNNRAANGASIYNYKGTINSLSGCTFINNTVTSTGTAYAGAIFNFGNSASIITSLSNCTFINNTGKSAGAIANGGVITSLSGCTFTGNTATSGFGGAIVNMGTVTSLSGCTFTGNTAATYGGAIYNSGSSASTTVHYCSFVNNTANTSGSTIYRNSGTVNAEYNWWGSNSNPSSQIGGTVDYNNWLYMTLTVPSTIEKGGTGTVIVSFNNATDGTNVNPVDPSVGHIPDGTVVSFNSALGTFNPTTAVTTNGTATTTFTATTMGSGVVNATTNSQTISSPNTVSVYEVPVANFTATTVNGIQPLTVKFLDISSGMPSSWYWDFGDGSSSTEENPIHIYTVAGKYNVTLKAGNDYGNNTIIKSNFITVHAYAPPVANFTMDKNWGINNVTVQFNDTSVGQNINSWYWDFGDGSSSTEQNPTHTYNSVGNYTLTLTATSPEGSSTKTGSVNVFDSSVPFSNYRGINIFVANDNGVKYDVEDGVVASNTAGITYIYVPDTYFVNFRYNGGGLNPIHISTDSSGTSQVVTNGNQSGTFWITFTGGQPTMPEAILMLAINGTIPDDFALHLTSSGYTWDLYPSAAQNYLGTINNLTYVTDALNETFTKSDFIYDSYWKLNSGNLDGTNAYLPIYSGQNMSDTNNTFHIMFIDLYAGALNPSKVSGLINNGAIKVDYSFTDLESFAAFNVYGWYSASNHGTGIIMTNNVDSGYNVAGVLPSVSDFTANATTGNNSLAVQFTDNSTNNPTSWSWDFGDGSTSALQNPTHTYTKPGKYTVTLTAANLNGGNMETKTGYITVLDTVAPVLNVTPKGGSYHSSQSVVLAASELSEIYYTLDGTTPTRKSMKYSGPISVKTSKKLNYTAWDSAGNQSLIYTQQYRIYKSVRYSYVVKDYYKKGWYKHYYYKYYKHWYKKWYKSHGKWKFKWKSYWKHKLAYKWKYGWVYRYVTKYATKNVLT